MRLLAAAHEDHAFDGIVILLEAKLAEPRRVADRHVANVPDANRHAVVAADDDVSDVVGIADQTDAAYVVELPALGVESAAGIGVIGAPVRS